VIRDIRRKITGNERLEQRFVDLLALAMRVGFRDHRQRRSTTPAQNVSEDRESPDHPADRASWVNKADLNQSSVK